MAGKLVGWVLAHRWRQLGESGWRVTTPIRTQRRLVTKSVVTSLKEHKAGSNFSTSQVNVAGGAGGQSAGNGQWAVGSGQWAVGRSRVAGWLDGWRRWWCSGLSACRFDGARLTPAKAR